MKRRDLERYLAAHGCHKLREGAAHALWGLDDERLSAVPRHREIRAGTVRAICRQLGIPPPPNPR